MKKLDLKQQSLILGIILLVVGVVWFFIEFGKYNGYKPTEAYVTGSFYSSGHRHTPSRAAAFVQYTVDGTEYKASVNMHCNESTLKSLEKTNVRIYYDPKAPQKAVSEKDKKKFPTSQFIAAMSGLGFILYSIVLRKGDVSLFNKRT